MKLYTARTEKGLMRLVSRYMENHSRVPHTIRARQKTIDTFLKILGGSPYDGLQKLKVCGVDVVPDDDAPLGVFYAVG